MSDRREKQPQKRTIDFRNETRGNYEFTAKITVSTYHSIKNEDVFSRDVTVLLRADNFSDACGTAQVVSGTLSLVHDVWQTNIMSVSEGIA